MGAFAQRPLSYPIRGVSAVLRQPSPGSFRCRVTGPGSGWWSPLDWISLPTGESPGMGAAIRIPPNPRRTRFYLVFLGAHGTHSRVVVGNLLVVVDWPEILWGRERLGRGGVMGILTHGAFVWWHGCPRCLGCHVRPASRLAVLYLARSANLARDPVVVYRHGAGVVVQIDLDHFAASISPLVGY